MCDLEKQIISAAENNNGVDIWDLVNAIVQKVRSVVQTKVIFGKMSHQVVVLQGSELERHHDARRCHHMHLKVFSSNFAA